MADLLPDHSPLGASAMYRWLPCPGSVQLAVGHTIEEASEYAKEGSAAHKLAQDCLESGEDAWEHIGQLVGPGDDRGPDLDKCVTVSKDMADAVQIYLNSVRHRYPDRNQGNFYVEYGFHCPTIHSLFYGQADMVFIDFENRQLDTDDYKHGAGIVVDVQENPQLMYYAVGVLESMNLWEKIDKVTLRIVQPRGWHTDGPIRAWSITTAMLWQWVEDTLIPAMENAETSRELVSGEHCRFCPVRYHACPQIAKDFDELEELMNILAEKGGAKKLTNIQLGRYLTLADTAKMISKSANETAFARLNAGKKVPGRKLARSRTNRAWDEGAEEALKAQFGDSAYETKLVSPAKIDGLPEGNKFTGEWSSKPEGKLTVVAESDARTGVSTDISALFTDQTKKGKK